MAFDWFKRLLKKQQYNQALDLSKQTFNQTNTQANNQTSEPSSIELDKESIQLGLAAGYTGRSIYYINTTLNRIETLMPSKDWLTIELSEHFRHHEENEQRRLETIITALNSLHSISLEAPEPLKTKLLDKINLTESNLGLSNRMKELIQIIKLYGEINYSDLAQKMNLTESGLRSLLVMTLRRTNEIEKFERDNRKWLRYNQNTALNIQTSTNQSTYQPNNQTNNQAESTNLV